MRPVYGCAHPLSGGPLRPEKWCHPCYLGASYLHCGWAWLYECWQAEEPEWEFWNWYPYWPVYECDPQPWRAIRELQAIPGGIWPHLCRQLGDDVAAWDAGLYAGPSWERVP